MFYMATKKRKTKNEITIDLFVDEKIAELQQKYKHHKMLWKVFSTIIAIINIIILSLCFYLLWKLLTTYFADSNRQSLFKEIGPQLFIVGFTIFLFPLTFFTTIYSTIMKAAKYKEAIESIQYISIKYAYNIDQYKVKRKKDEIYKKEIKEIVDKTTESIDKNISFRKALAKSLIESGNNEPI